jgi:hypothetical protein
MLEVLKQYDKSTAEGLLARTSFYLNDNPILFNAGSIKDEDSIRSRIIDEICTKLGISNNIDKNKRKIDNYIDSELEKSMRLDKETEKKIIHKLSKEACLPTDLYKIKIIKSSYEEYYSYLKNEMPFIETVVKNPGLESNLSSLESSNQGDISIFAKYFKKQPQINSFYLLVIGKRDGVNFIVDHAWRLYDDIFCPVKNALDLLKIFVNNFGVKTKFQNKKNKTKEFDIKIYYDEITKTDTGKFELSFFHYMKPTIDGNSEYSLFFVIDLLKYQNYLKKHGYIIKG